MKWAILFLLLAAFIPTCRINITIPAPEKQVPAEPTPVTDRPADRAQRASPHRIECKTERDYPDSAPPASQFPNGDPFYNPTTEDLERWGMFDEDDEMIGVGG